MEKMKSVAGMIVLVAALLLSGVAADKAHADDWGCECLLCLSNPSGPMAVAECVPPITKLYNAMKKRGFTFPKCEMANASGSSANLTSNYYDVCPTGYTELGGLNITTKSWEGRPKNSGTCGGWGMPAKCDTVYLNERNYTIWNGSFISGVVQGSEDWGRKSKLCGKGYRGNVDLAVPTYDSEGGLSYASYDGIQVWDEFLQIQPYANPTVIDVYIDNAFYRRVPVYGGGGTTRLFN